MTEENLLWAELAKVRQFVADTVKNGSSAENARPADGIRRTVYDKEKDLHSLRRRRALTTPREKKADAWATWFCKRMAESNSQDPAKHLPDALAKLETMIADKIAEELGPARRRIAELERVAKAGTITAWKLNRERYAAIPYTADGRPGRPWM